MSQSQELLLLILEAVRIQLLAYHITVRQDPYVDQLNNGKECDGRVFSYLFQAQN
jgi:glucosamine 6-phosphate synthetase-like amidotransferase/phosphosugar isomerase protein